jgi:hypothetical protein
VGKGISLVNTLRRVEDAERHRPSAERNAWFLRAHSAARRTHVHAVGVESRLPGGLIPNSETQTEVSLRDASRLEDPCRRRTRDRGLGAFASTQGRSSSSTKPLAHWGLYSAAKWDVVATTFARRGFARDSVRIVTGTRLANGQAFALIGASSNSGGSCFAVARGTLLRATICRIVKPLTVFSAPDTCAACSPAGPALKTRSILALVRGDVTVKMISRGHASGIGVVPAGDGFAFNSSFVHSGDRLQARDASGRVLATVTFRSS